MRDVIRVDLPFEAVAPHFVNGGAWLTRIAEETTHRSDLRCEVGPVRAVARSIVLPMRLRNTNGDPGFPDLTGDLAVAPDGDHGCTITLAATYRRTTGDRAALERIERTTEAGVRTFLEGIVRALGDPAEPAG